MSKETKEWIELKQGCEKFFKVCCYVAFLWWLIDLLPHLPDEISSAIVKKLLSPLMDE